MSESYSDWLRDLTAEAEEKAAIEESRAQAAAHGVAAAAAEREQWAKANLSVLARERANLLRVAQDSYAALLAAGCPGAELLNPHLQGMYLIPRPRARARGWKLHTSSGDVWWLTTKGDVVLRRGALDDIRRDIAAFAAHELDPMYTEVRSDSPESRVVHQVKHDRTAELSPGAFQQWAHGITTDWARRFLTVLARHGLRL